eukprot:TRINITY_DN11024_c0_g1_i1.p1 TRINITY_DN11024_c0_g1~~TRINITY_DN11024_c0_g1_i1.p1  ORF type:complete len:219 (-),score=30.90 TRINITY_DN11024_c0_g1_i1:398-1054(-)
MLFADGYWTNHRKNYELVYSAFTHEFSPDENVELYLKLTENSPELVDIERSAPPNVKFFRGRISQKKLLTLLRKAHCLVFPSHGEGFGLPPREAMSTGMPVILAGFAGLRPIAKEAFAFPLAWHYQNASGYDSLKIWNRESNDFGQWAGIDESDLRKRMREAMTSPQKTILKGKRAAKYVRKHEIYDLTVAKIESIMYNTIRKPKRDSRNPSFQADIL